MSTSAGMDPTRDGLSVKQVQLCNPAGIFSGKQYGPNVDYIFADSCFQIIRKVSNGTVSTIAGQPYMARSTTKDANSLALDVTLDNPDSLTVASNGDVYFTEPRANYVKKIKRVISADGSDRLNTVEVVTGTGTEGVGANNVIGTNSATSTPYGTIVVNYRGVSYLLFSDGSHNIRMVDLSTQIINTLAGSGSATGKWSTGGYSPDGTPISVAKFKYPRHLAAKTNDDGELMIYVSEYGNNCIRRFLFNNGTLETVAGVCQQEGYEDDDGVIAVNSTMNGPGALAINKQGELIFVDAYNYRIRTVTSDGLVKTITGYGGTSGKGLNNVPATKSKIGTVLWTVL